ncbi:MAG: OmpH family outer membrane protein, partial [Pseudomonadota bacterium]
LQDSKDSLSKEDFAKRYQALMGRAQQVGQLEQIKKAELGQSRAKALVDLNKALQPVVKEILEKKKATVLLERSAVVFANDDMDITDEIVKALDKKVKTVNVEKIDLVAQAKAAQAKKK